MRHFWLLPAVAGIAGAQCPYLSGEMSFTQEQDNAGDTIEVTEQPIDNTLYVNDTGSYMTTDFGTPISDQTSLKAGPRGPTLLEDFIFRQKLQRFDHERVSTVTTAVCSNNKLTQWFSIRSPSASSTPVVQVHMVLSNPTPTGRTSRLPIS